MSRKSRKMKILSALAVITAVLMPQNVYGVATINAWSNLLANDSTCQMDDLGNWNGAHIPLATEIALFGTTPTTGNAFPNYSLWSTSTSFTPVQIYFGNNIGANPAPTSPIRYVLDFSDGAHSFGTPVVGSNCGVDNAGAAPTLIRVYSTNASIAAGTSLTFNQAQGLGNLPCSADISNTGVMQYEVLTGGHIAFTGALSTASNANFLVKNTDSTLNFSSTSTATAATIDVQDNASLNFSGNSTAQSAIISASDNGLISFSGSATGSFAQVTLKKGSTTGGILTIGANNTLLSLDSDIDSEVNLGINTLTITGAGQTMTIGGLVNGPNIGTGGALVFNNTVAGTGNRTTTYFLRDSTELFSYTGSTTVSGNNNLIGNTTSLANSVIVNSTTASSTVTFEQNFNGIFKGNITGAAVNTDAVVVTGSGEVQIPSILGIPSGTSSVAVPVTIKNGTLVGDTGSLLSNVTLTDYNSKLIFRQTGSGTYSKNIVSNVSNGTVGKVVIDIPALAALTINDSNLVNVGLVEVKSGGLIGNGNNLLSDIALGNNTNLTLSAITSAYSNNISGTGSVQITPKGSVGTVFFSGVNTYSGGTTVGANVGLIGNTLAIQGNILLNDPLAGLVFDQSGGTNAPITNGIYSGNISGSGGTVVQGGQKVIFSGVNSYTGGTIVSGANTSLVGTTASLQGLVIGLANNANLTFSQSYNGTNTSNIIGTGTLTVNGTGAVNLLGTNTFTGSITVAKGTLQGNTNSLQQDISNLGNLEFIQQTSGTYAKSITGTGNIIKSGSGTLIFTTPQIATDAYVREGELKLNTTLTGNGTIESGGTLTGMGIITGNLNVKSGGVLKPGNSIGSMTVGGNYQQQVDSQYGVQIDGAGNRTETFVAGSITLNGGEVDVTSSDGTFLLNHKYEVMHSNLTNGLVGTFSEVNAHGFFNPKVVQANALYDSQNAYIILNTDFQNCAISQNEENIAFILDNWVNPPTDIEVLMQALVLLPCNEINIVLDEMSGEQYAGEMTVASMANRQFIRRLYDPLRNLLKTSPCYTNYITDNCCRDSLDSGHSMWLEVGGTTTSIESNHDGYGLHANGYEVVGGVQHTFDYDWTFGLGVGYFENNISFKLPGKGKMNTVDVGIYGLYRPDTYYILGDLTFGTSTDNVERRVIFSEIDTRMRGKTHIYQGTFYGEAGFDYMSDCGLLGYVLAQPFLGFELGYTHRNRIKERNGGSLNLQIGEKGFFNAYSRLGVHLNTVPQFGQICMSLDFAWLYRLSSAGRTNNTHFIASGDSFNIYGASEQKSSFEGILNLGLPLGDYLHFYLEATGLVGQAATSCSVLGGIQANW